MDFIVANEATMKKAKNFKDLTEEPMLLYELLMRSKLEAGGNTGTSEDVHSVGGGDDGYGRARGAGVKTMYASPV